MQLFEMRPLHFMPKPLAYEKIETSAKIYLKVADIWSGMFTYKVGHEVRNVKIKEIIYVESRNRKLILHLSENRTDVTPLPIIQSKRDEVRAVYFGIIKRRRV